MTSIRPLDTTLATQEKLLLSRGLLQCQASRSRSQVYYCFVKLFKIVTNQLNMHWLGKKNIVIRDKQMEMQNFSDLFCLYRSMF